MTSKLPTEEMLVADLIPYAKNAKKHPPAQIERIKSSIRSFGFTVPIVVDKDNVIIAGHGRRLALLELGWEKVDVIKRRDLTKDQADALRLAENHVVGRDFDSNMIQEELARLAETLDISDIGYDNKELEFLTAELGDIDFGAIAADITAAVDEQKSENDKKVAEIDAATSPVGDALGFKRVSVTQSRKIRAFITQIETETGETGADALVAFIDGLAA